MKKLFALIVVTLMLGGVVFADSGSRGNRINSTTKAYTASTLVKRGNAEVLSINFIATSNGGSFMILDALSDTTLTGSSTDVKAEGQQATSGNTYVRDYGNNPLQLDTGLYLIVSNGTVLITYN